MWVTFTAQDSNNPALVVQICLVFDKPTEIHLIGGKWLRGLKKSKTRDLPVKYGVLRVKSDLVQFLALYHTLVVQISPTFV